MKPGLAGWRWLAGTMLLLAGAASPAAETIEGVFSLRLGQTPEEARRTLAEDEHFRRIAGRYHGDFPLYETALGGHAMRLRPTFQGGKLVEIELRFRRDASPNEIDPVIRDQVGFAVSTLSGRFGEPDSTPVPVARIEPKAFEDGGRVVSHRWRRGDRVAEVVLWRERFDHGTAIVLAEQHSRNRSGSAVEAF